MAGENFYTSVTTIYGDTIDLSDDNSSTVAGATNNAALSGNTLTISGDANWNGNADMVIFNKRINFTGTDPQFYDGNSSAGRQQYFVNCVIDFSGATLSTPQDNIIGSSSTHNGSGAGQRGNEVTGTKSSDKCSFFYNCKFIIGDGSAERPGIVVGGIFDCYYIQTNPASGGITFFPQTGARIEGLYGDGAVVPSNSAAFGTIFQFFGSGDAQPETFQDVTLVSNMVYLASSDRFELKGYGGNSTAGLNAFPVTIPDGYTGRPLLMCTGGSSGHGAFLNTPRYDFTQDGSIRWRRNPTGGRVIMAQSIQPQFFSDAALSTGRKDVVYYMDSQVSYGTAGNFATLTTSPGTKTARTFTSQSDGYLDGTYDFKNGNATSGEYQEIELPVIMLSQDGDATIYGDGANDSTNGVEYTGSNNNSRNRFENTQTDFETDVTTMSLWGTTFSSETKDENLLDSDGDTAGNVIPTDHYTLFDPDDLMMNEYSDTITNVTGKLTTTDTTSVSLNDIGANWKYHVWNNSSYDEWHADTVDGDTFDISVASGSVDGIILDPSATDTSSFGENDATFTCPTTASNEVTIAVAAGDQIQELKGDTLSVASGNSLVLDGGTYDMSGTINRLRDYSSVPGSSDYSIRNATVAGTINVQRPTASGDTAYIKLDDVTIPSDGLTINATGSGSGDVVVIFSGTKTGSLTLGSNVTEQTQFTVTFQLDGEDYIVANQGAGRWTTSATAGSPGTWADLGSDGRISDGTNDTVAWTFTVDASHTNVWVAFAYDGYQIATVVNSADKDQTVTLSKVGVTNLAFDTANYDTWGTVDVSTSNVTVDAPTSASDTSYGIRCDATGTRVTATGATSAKTRLWLRREFQESDAMMEAFAQDFAPTDMFDFRLNDIIGVKNSEVSRFQLNRAADTATTGWRVGAIAVDAGDDSDQFDSLTSGTGGENINFTPLTSGASVGQIEALIDDQTEELFGTPSGGTDRTLSDVYKKANLAAALSA